MINYDGKKFRNTEPGPDGTAPVGTYHQSGNLVWGEANGGQVRRCSLVGMCDYDGKITLGYAMVLNDGQLVVGRCVSTPERLDDDRIQLREDWERYEPNAATGVSYLEEL